VKQENKSVLKRNCSGHPVKLVETKANGEAMPENLAQRILALIKETGLKAGDQLPPERELSAILKVSRPSLREALHALKLMNIIENRQGSGTFVSSLTPEKLVEHLDIEFALDDSTYATLLQARTILEAGMVALAAENISNNEICEIERCLDEALKVIDDPEIFMARDIDLHRRIMKAAGNRIIQAFMHLIDRVSIYSRRRTGDDMEVRRQAINDHGEIVTALKAHDPDAARKAMIAHLSHVGKKFNLFSVS
jgi:GntR family transcriptional regulator, transcriptional repressor for pyruvate dehydrogenase complex